MLYSDNWVNRNYYSALREKMEMDQYTERSKLIKTVKNENTYSKPKLRDWYKRLVIILFLVLIIAALIVPKIIWTSCGDNMITCIKCVLNDTSCHSTNPTNTTSSLETQIYLGIMLGTYAPIGTSGLLLGSLHPSFTTLSYLMASLSLFNFPAPLLSYWIVAICWLQSFVVGVIFYIPCSTRSCCCYTGDYRFKYSLVVLGFSNGIIIGRIVGSLLWAYNIIPSWSVLVVMIGSGILLSIIIAIIKKTRKRRIQLLVFFTALGGSYFCILPWDAAYLHIFTWMNFSSQPVPETTLYYSIVLGVMIVITALTAQFQYCFRNLIYSQNYTSI